MLFNECVKPKSEEQKRLEVGPCLQKRRKEDSIAHYTGPEKIVSDFFKNSRGLVYKSIEQSFKKNV